MTAIIETEQLTKSYGASRGIVDLDLEVDEGEVFGFLGPNGAGKTTTIRTLLDHLRPTSGRARIFGIETTADPVAIHRRTGYLAGEFPPPPRRPPPPAPAPCRAISPPPPGYPAARRSSTSGTCAAASTQPTGPRS